MNGGACTAGGCAGGACGRLGQPACPGGFACTAPYTEDVNGTCVACGGVGQRCCQGGGNTPYCGGANVCGPQGNLCEACGGQGQPCCLGRSCTGTATCNGQNRCN
jgi:hypothetical protein